MFDSDPDFSAVPTATSHFFCSAGLLEHIASHYEKNGAKRSRLRDYIDLEDNFHFCRRPRPENKMSRKSCVFCETERNWLGIDRLLQKIEGIWLIYYVQQIFNYYYV